MGAQDQEIIREFLTESHENLSRLDLELVELENRPQDGELLGSVFRTVHTIKGTCGFLGFSKLERIAHHAEALLSQLRSGQRPLTAALTSLILAAVDAIRRILASIEASGSEGPADFEELVHRLDAEAHAPATATPGEPAQEARPGPEAPAQKTSQVADSNIRVGVGLLDKLMDLVGELVLARNQILQFNSEHEDTTLAATSQRLNLITTELQDGVMKTRMQPIGIVWNNLPRVVRDLALSVGKKIHLHMEGATTELDRTIIEAIKDPLVHLVRNACDHGIETIDARARAGKPAEGRLSLRAWHEGGQVNIEIGDDGAGIDLSRVRQKALDGGFLPREQTEKLSDRELINLIFHPGLSTAARVSNLSGRGVGMDVVKTHIEKIGGTIDVATARGEGTRVKLKIPLTLAIIPGLVIHSGGERFVIPQASLRELIRLRPDSPDRKIEMVNGVPVYRRRGKLLPIAFLNDVLHLHSTDGAESLSMIVLQAEDQQFGLMVDGISDTQEIVVKPLGAQLKGLNVYAGATIMGDGRVSLILDVHGIGERAGVLNDAVEQAKSGAEQKVASAERLRVLLFGAGEFVRMAVPLSLVARLEDIPREAIEMAAGAQVVQYRGGLLTLVDLQRLLEPDAAQIERTPIDPVPVIVFTDGQTSLGVMVDRILDIAEESVTVRQESNRAGILGSAVIAGKVTDFLDLGYVMSATRSLAPRDPAAQLGQKRVLVADASSFTRGVIRAGLDMAGYGVTEAAGIEQVRARLGADLGAVLVGEGMAREYADLPNEIRRTPGMENMPVVALMDRAGAGGPELSGYSDVVAGFDRDAMLASLARLSTAVSRAVPEAVLAGGQEKTHV